MSPITTGSWYAATFVRSWSTIGCDSSMPVTGTPRWASGTATRPVPIASSSALPPPASSARRSTVGFSTSGANIPVPGVSYRWAASASQMSSCRTCSSPAVPSSLASAPTSFTPDLGFVGRHAGPAARWSLSDTLRPPRGEGVEVGRRRVSPVSGPDRLLPRPSRPPGTGFPPARTRGLRQPSRTAHRSPWLWWAEPSPPARPPAGWGTPEPLPAGSSSGGIVARFGPGHRSVEGGLRWRRRRRPPEHVRDPSRNPRRSRASRLAGAVELGGRAFYDGILTTDAAMVFPGAVLDRAQSLDAIASADPWSEYRIEDPRLVELGETAALLTYRAEAVRNGAPYRAMMTTAYVRDRDRWRVALHQQTPF